MEPAIGIDPMSVRALCIECYFNDTRLGSGTGFLIKKNNIRFLVTNWHVLSGRHPETKALLDKKTAAIPNNIKVWHSKKGDLKGWTPKTYRILDEDGNRLWREHSFKNGDMFDVVLLELPHAQDIDYYDVDLLWANTDMVISPSEPVSIIGFPCGNGSFGYFPIWKTGYVASDIDIPAIGKPLFLIDARTKSGMSGAPVVAVRHGAVRRKNGVVYAGVSSIRFMGIYSGKVNDKTPEPDIGVVWKPEVIDILLKS